MININSKYNPYCKRCLVYQYLRLKDILTSPYSQLRTAGLGREDFEEESEYLHVNLGVL